VRNILANQKVRMLLALTFLSLIAIASFSNPLEALARLILILAVTLTSEYALSFYRKAITGKPISAIITAEVLFLISNPDSSIFQIFLAIVIAVTINHYLKPLGRHIFNPAAAGLFIASFFGLKLTWWGLLPGVIFSTLTILLAGSVTIYTLRQEKIIAPFIATVLGMTLFVTRNAYLTFTQFLIGGFWFFSLVMLPEETSSPIFSKNKVLYGITVAIFSFMIPKVGLTTEPLLTSLLIGNFLFWYLEAKRSMKEKKLAAKLPLASKLLPSE